MDKDLFAVTDTLEVEDLIRAYDIGVFPWPVEESALTPWFKPEKRGVLFFDHLHISQSFKKFLKSTELKVSFCQNFDDVIENCSTVKRKEQSGTWINTTIIEAYKKLYALKRAYSVEVWNKKDLVGGLYGVLTDRCVSGESMFFKESGASKLALYTLIVRLKRLGLSFIDTQMVTPLVKSFGGENISKQDFDKLLLSVKIKEHSKLFRELKDD